MIPILVGGMLGTGAANSLFSKYQDNQCVAFCDNPILRHNFEQPVWQTATMFLGESLCLLAFILLFTPLNPFRRASVLPPILVRQPTVGPDNVLGIDSPSAFDSAGQLADGMKPHEGEGEAGMAWKKAVLFWLPAVCDICGTTAMNVGLIFVPVSAYQMLRGALVLLVGIFSVVFLKRRLTRAQWIALVTVMLGVSIVGYSATSGSAPPTTTEGEAEERDPLLGVILIVVAQVFTASQFVIEERIMERYSVAPLLAVGYEGFFGLSTTLLGMPILHFLIGSTPAGKGGYFDVPNGWHEIIDNPKVWGSSVAIAISIAFFNFCGLAVTQRVSATARSTIDTCRTVIIWLVSLSLGWEHFKLLQLLGFALLVYGTFVFNGITRFPGWTRFHLLAEEGETRPEVGERTRLIQEEE